MRKTKDYVVPMEGRDKDKVFRITEMSAADAEWWALRALKALAKSGMDIGDIQSMPMQTLAITGIQHLFKLGDDDIKPLLDQMWKCVKIVPDPKNNPLFDRPLNEDDVEEVATLLMLRAEVIALHTGFSMSDVRSTQPTSGPSSQGSKSTPTSPARSGRLSPRDRHR